MKTKFEQIAQNRNGELKINDQNVSGKGLHGRGVTTYHLSVTTYCLTINYLGIDIRIENEFGNHNIGYVKTTIPNQQFAEFETTERGIFSKIIDGKSPFILIKCKDKLFKSQVKNHQSFLQLNELAKADLFEPYITGKNTNEGFEIQTRYSLAFKSREKAVDLLIDFYEMLIETYR